MPAPRTGAERYLAQRLSDPDYRSEYARARERVEQVDAVIRMLDERRFALRWSKAELARRAGLKAEVIRRLFSAEAPNPTLTTLIAVADALELDLRPEPREAKQRPATRGPTAASRTRRRAV